MEEFENLLIDGWEDEEYQAFVDKFKTKKTTDDCYTPPEIYRVIADYVANRYRLNREDFVRPFFPGGDYKHHPYPPHVRLSTIRRSVLSRRSCDSIPTAA